MSAHGTLRSCASVTAFASHERGYCLYGGKYWLPPLWLAPFTVDDIRWAPSTKGAFDPRRELYLCVETAVALARLRRRRAAIVACSGSIVDIYDAFATTLAARFRPVLVAQIDELVDEASLRQFLGVIASADGDAADGARLAELFCAGQELEHAMLAGDDLEDWPATIEPSSCASTPDAPVVAKDSFGGALVKNLARQLAAFVDREAVHMLLVIGELDHAYDLALRLSDPVSIAWCTALDPAPTSARAIDAARVALALVETQEQTIRVVALIPLDDDALRASASRRCADLRCPMILAARTGPMTVEPVDHESDESVIACAIVTARLAAAGDAATAEQVLARFCAEQTRLDSEDAAIASLYALRAWWDGAVTSDEITLFERGAILALLHAEMRGGPVAAESLMSRWAAVRDADHACRSAGPTEPDAALRAERIAELEDQHFQGLHTDDDVAWLISRVGHDVRGATRRRLIAMLETSCGAARTLATDVIACCGPGTVDPVLISTRRRALDTAVAAAEGLWQLAPIADACDALVTDPEAPAQIARALHTLEATYGSRGSWFAAKPRTQLRLALVRILALIPGCSQEAVNLERDMRTTLPPGRLRTALASASQGVAVALAREGEVAGVSSRLGGLLAESASLDARAIVAALILAPNLAGPLGDVAHTSLRVIPDLPAWLGHLAEG